jgi:RNA polymerase sigma-70 factor, ECF subfamily
VATILECERITGPRGGVVSGPSDRDAELVQALRRGEPDAADRLVATYQSRAYRLARRITGNVEDAEEAVQDAFWSVLQNIALFRGDAAFGTWLYRIVTNGALQKIRRRRGQPLEMALDEVLPVFDEHGRHVSPCVDWSSAVEDASREAELRLALTAAIDELPAHYRPALVLRDVEGLSLAEIAETLGIPIGTVKTRIHRARLFVRNRLTKSLAVGLVV